MFLVNTKNRPCFGLWWISRSAFLFFLHIEMALNNVSVCHCPPCWPGQDMFRSTPTLFFLALSCLFAFFYGLNCHQFFVTIVKSQSMMPALHRGDVLFSTNTGVEIEVKDIVLAQVSSIIWHYRLWSFKSRDKKLERFLPKNQHTQRKLLKFANWTTGEPQ